MKNNDALRLAIAQQLAVYVNKTEEILDSFITTDEDLNIVKAKVMKLWNKNCPVLITGETGTGKELIAKALHGDRTGQFVDVNCAAIPFELMESELFGSTKGAYTSANQDREGLIEAAMGGTLFLDEIGDMPLSLQPKLLRVLNDGYFRRIGDTRKHQMTCRIVCATNRTKTELLSKEKFRQDLYYRISTVVLHLKPLRERPKNDIELLVKYFAKGHTEVVSPVMEMLRSDNLDGNVRELKNIVEESIMLL